MDLGNILKILRVIVSLILIFWLWSKIPNTKVKSKLVGVISIFTASLVIFSGEGLIYEWSWHVCFYSAQVIFYFFIVELINSFHVREESENQHPNIEPANMIILGMSMAKGMETAKNPVGLRDWFAFLTDQGLQHIITIPLFFLIITLIKIQRAYIQTPQYRSILNIFLVGEAMLVMIHVGEFLIESQKLIPQLNGYPNEILEFVWFIMAILSFALGVKKLSSLQKTV